MISSTKKYIIDNLMAFAFVGVIIRLMFKSDITTDGSSGPANAFIWGYGVVSLSVFAAVFLSFSLASNMSALNKDIIGFIKTIFSDSSTSILTLIIFTWIIVLNVTYFRRINQGKVSPEYSTLSRTSTLFLLIQISALFYYLREQVSNQSGQQLNSKMPMVIYITSFINALFVGIMNINLKYFSTDG
jgi:hypothetical protein